MKIIHTADWHLGQEFFQYDRQAEHEHFFECLRRIVADERPDALVVSGDVYHNATPSNATMKLFTDNMVLLHNTMPQMVIVVVAGNHDSCTRLESTSEVWRLANVHVVGGVQRDADTGLFIAERHIIEVPGKGYILAVPFIQNNNLPIFKQLQDDVAKRNTAGLPVVMTAHLFIKGVDITGHDERQMVGGIESESIDTFGNDYDYLALGHIHFPQTLKGGKARYSGSAIQVNFDENYPHSVSIVEMEKHGEPPVIRTAEIGRTMRFYTIPAQPKPFEAAIAELTAFNPDKPGYVRLNVLVKDYTPANAEAITTKVVEDKPDLKFCRIITTRREDEKKTSRQQFNVQEVKEMNPIELAKIYYREKCGTDMDEHLSALLAQVVDSVKSNEQYAPNNEI